MWKTVLAGSTALAIAGATLAYAQQGPGGRDFAPRWQPSAEDISAFGDARIAALHAGLKLTAEQEKNWPAVESALRDLAKQRSERFAARASADRPTDLIERLGLARRGDDATRRRAQEARRRGRPALQEPGRGPEAPLRHARAAGRTAIRRRTWPARIPRLDASRAGRVRARPDGTRGWPAAAISDTWSRVASQKPPGAPGGFSASIWAGERGWTPRPAFAKRTSPGGVPPTAIRAHSSVGRAADS